MSESERTRNRKAPAASGGRAEPPGAETAEAAPASGNRRMRDTEAEAEELKEQERRFTDEGGASG
jgi:hypothetical protein